jgi:rRNA processing protein Gar1
MVREFRSEDEGKRVVAAEGRRVGTVVNVSGRVAHVKPVPDLSQQMRQRLGWTVKGQETYRLRRGAVEEMSGETIRLRATPGV